MLDLNFVRDNLDLVKEKMSNRNFDPSLLEDFTKLDSERRKLIRERDELNASSNRVSKEVGALMRDGRKDEAEGLKAESRAITEKSREIETRLTDRDHPWVVEEGGDRVHSVDGLVRVQACRGEHVVVPLRDRDGRCRGLHHRHHPGRRRA